MIDVLDGESSTLVGSCMVKLLLVDTGNVVTT